MVDVPGNISTTVSIGVGGSVTGSLETIGDHDWYRIQLTAGQSISVALNALSSGGVTDPYLRVYDATGTLLFENDDSGPGLNSLLAFSATSSGTYYIDVGAWDDNYTGAYQLSVSPYTPPPLFTNDQIANQLVNTYWGGPAGAHRFPVSSGGSISVTLTGLTAEGQYLAREALALWSDVTGVRFNEVSAGGQITFDDNEEGAFADANDAGGIISSAHVNVSTDWLTRHGTDLNSYSFQTYIHEIGHALGLGHAGDYNGSARYPFEATFLNDSWATSVMSYFDQGENTYFAGLGFTPTYIVSPMAADILAMSMMYGLSTTTRSGDTTYGFNSNAGRAIFDASRYTNVSYTIFDNGGIDTLNYSGFSANQRIDLNPEAFSNVGNRTGVVTIARGTVIENAIGGAGSDALIGNSVTNALNGGGGNDTLTGGAGNDTLTGGSGNDTFRDTAAGLNGDRIMDFQPGDRIVISDANANGFTFSLNGSVLSFAGGSVVLQGVAGQLAATAAPDGGVELRFAGTTRAAAVPNDFNGDGRSDVLWRNDAGAVTNWLGQLNGGFTSNNANAFSQTDASWRVAGSGDFNGDGRADILWRHSTGSVTDWLGQASGGFTANTGNAFHQAALSWQIAGAGDFNGDGRDDVLWRGDSGLLTSWFGQANGSFTATGPVFLAGAGWQVAGTGDFNGDGRADVLWRHGSGGLTDWLGQASGGFAANSGVHHQVGLNWQVVGTGDFNGDGRDDILWRDSSGALTNWLGQANGGFVANNAAYSQVDRSWHVADTGDFNGDGRDDIAWRNDSGAFTVWHGQLNGAFVNSSASWNNVATSWQVQAADILIA